MTLLVNGEDIRPKVAAWLREQAEHWPPDASTVWPPPFGDVVTDYGKRCPALLAAPLGSKLPPGPLPVEWYATLIDGSEVVLPAENAP